MVPVGESHLTIISDTSARRISRRELAHQLFSGLAAGLASPLLSPSHVIHARLLNGSLLDFADQTLSSSDHRLLFLSASQFYSLASLLEALVPGSRNAQSAEFIDLLLSVDASQHQQEFVASLSAMEAAAMKSASKSPGDLNQDQLRQLLEAASAGDSPDHEHFENLKNWAVGAYYSSEAGMRELGWTPDRVFPAYPGCTHADSHS